MSIESLMDTIESAVIESELEDIPDMDSLATHNEDEDSYISLAPDTTVNANDATIETKVVNDNTPKRKGRPMLHTKAGRVYFLKSEVDEIRNDPEAFDKWMKSTYEVSEARKAELEGNLLVSDLSEVSYTLFGETLEVLEKAEKICELYPEHDITFEISKKKLVAPTNAAYAQPIVDTVNIKGKNYSSIVFQEFSDSVIYVYLTIRPTN